MWYDTQKKSSFSGKISVQPTNVHSITNTRISSSYRTFFFCFMGMISIVTGLLHFSRLTFSSQGVVTKEWS